LSKDKHSPDPSKTFKKAEEILFDILLLLFGRKLEREMVNQKAK